MSLDAPVVAVLWQILFARCFHAEVSPLAALVLALAVWLIYAADRVFDAWTKSGCLPRHEFYRRYWRAVAPVWTAVFAVAGWLAWTRLSADLFERGVLVLAAVAGYFVMVHLARRKMFPKEAAVAVLFAVGASLAAWGQVRSAVDVATIVLFSCLCWINCIAIDQWEREDSVLPVGLAAAFVAAAALALLYLNRPVLSGAETASALGFILLDRGRGRLSRDAVRVLADVALLSPLLFLPLAGFLA